MVRRDYAVASVGPHRLKPGPDRISPPRNLRLTTDRALISSSHTTAELADGRAGTGYAHSVIWTTYCGAGPERYGTNVGRDGASAIRPIFLAHLKALRSDRGGSQLEGPERGG